MKYFRILATACMAALFTACGGGGGGGHAINPGETVVVVTPPVARTFRLYPVPDQTTPGQYLPGSRDVPVGRFTVAEAPKAITKLTFRDVGGSLFRFVDRTYGYRLMYEGVDVATFGVRYSYSTVGEELTFTFLSAGGWNPIIGPRGYSIVASFDSVAHAGVAQLALVGYEEMDGVAHGEFPILRGVSTMMRSLTGYAQPYLATSDFSVRTVEAGTVTTYTQVLFCPQGNNYTCRPKVIEVEVEGGSPPGLQVGNGLTYEMRQSPTDPKVYGLSLEGLALPPGAPLFFYVKTIGTPVGIGSNATVFVKLRTLSIDIGVPSLVVNPVLPSCQLPELFAMQSCKG